MKKLLAAIALLLASGTAQAQYTFEYGGKTIRIDPDRGTVQIPGVYDNTKKAKKNEDAPAAKSKDKPAATTTAAPPPAAAPVEQPTAAAPPPPAQAPSAVAAPAAPPIQAPVPPPLGAAGVGSTTTAVATPTDNSVSPATSAPPQVQQSVTPAPAAAPPPAPTVAVAPPAPAPPPPRPAPVASNSPIGVWLTEEKEGQVRIEQCGSNLCGYSVDKKTNQNGEQVLINMKPGKDKWSGRILDPSTGSIYDSTIAMKGSDTLRVQGCVFGGAFCGGQTWTRVN
ncbi:MAG: DUF2147 domain-containing protein [Bradyrhizobium sp.]|nr:DUF2147 domain-containing protein [Bradyrhizobium sp.]